MRVGLYRPVHVKTLRSQKLRMLLTHRKLQQSKAIAIENDLRGTLRLGPKRPIREADIQMTPTTASQRNSSDTIVSCMSAMTIRLPYFL